MKKNRASKDGYILRLISLLMFQPLQGEQGGPGPMGERGIDGLPGPKVSSLWKRIID